MGDRRQRWFDLWPWVALACEVAAVALGARALSDARHIGYRGPISFDTPGLLAVPAGMVVLAGPFVVGAGVVLGTVHSRLARIVVLAIAGMLFLPVGALVGVSRYCSPSLPSEDGTCVVPGTAYLGMHLAWAVLVGVGAATQWAVGRGANGRIRKPFRLRSA